VTGIYFHFHLLRHYFTTFLLEKGVDFVTIGSLLGHSKITTSLIYSHTDRERKRRALELLEG
jgi:site-specific recombinase XerD